MKPAQSSGDQCRTTSTDLLSRSVRGEGVNHEIVALPAASPRSHT